MNRIDLDGRVAVVTGGAKGLGAAIGKRLMESGASLAIWDFDETALAEAIGSKDGLGPVRGYTVDVANAGDVDTAAAATVKDFGKIDILVNNAGISGLNFNGWEYPLEEWRRVVEIDLFGVFHCCRSVIPPMISKGYGRIVNIASISGKEGNPTATPYASAKAGVMALTKALGKELVQTGVLVNAVAPAAFETDILKQSTPEFVNYMLSKIPMGRLGQPDELAAMVAWLSSEECSFSTGAIFDISGGRATY